MPDQVPLSKKAETHTDASQTEGQPLAFERKESYTDASQTEAQPNEALPYKTESQKWEGKYCSCTIVERFKKPMTVMAVTLLLILNTIMVIVGIAVCCTSPCPIEAVIPIYLIGAGTLGITARALTIVKYFKSTQSVLLNRIMYGLIFFELIWLILGSCWIFINYEKRYECDGAAFMWAFFLLIVNYIILLSPIFIPCCIECYRYGFMRSSRNSNQIGNTNS